MWQAGHGHQALLLSDSVIALHFGLHSLSPTTKLRQGNVFTPVCDSVHRGVSLSRGVSVSVQGFSIQGVSVQGGLCQVDPPLPYSYIHAGGIHHTGMHSCYYINWNYYRPQQSWGKVIFSEACVKNSVHWEGCVCLDPDPGGGWGVWPWGGLQAHTLGGGSLGGLAGGGSPGPHPGEGGVSQLVLRTFWLTHCPFCIIFYNRSVYLLCIIILATELHWLGPC